MLDYLILILDIPTSAQEKLCARLFEQGCLGLETQESSGSTKIRAYFSDGAWTSKVEADLARSFGGLKVAAATPIRIPGGEDRSPTIRSLNLAGENLRLLLAPAFGTGAHPTTRMSAELLSRSHSKGKRVLDVGSGTGILAILAARFGAAEIVAVEISPEARDNAEANFQLNETPEISLYADLAEAAGTFDVVLANMLTPTLLHLAAEIQDRVAPGGICILSGITEEERPLIMERYGKKLRLLEELVDEGWLGLKFALKNPNENES